jgi:hypothetical protein
MPRNVQQALIAQAALALVFGAIVPAAAAQEVASVDVTQVTQRTTLRRPPSTAATSGGPTNTNENHACTDSSRGIGTLRTTLIALDRAQYQFGDQPIFEVTIENAGSEPVQLPYSPHLADLQPADASRPFDFSQLSLVLWVGGKRWNANMGGMVNLYGADDHPQTMLTLHPGEWVRIIAKGKIEPPLDGGVMDLVRAGDAINHANAQVSVAKTALQITATASSAVSTELCVTKLQGPAVPIDVTNPDQSTSAP